MEDKSIRAQIDLLKGLRAIRDFLPDPVPQAAIDDILDVARWTGSAKNEQPWDLIVVSDPNLLQQLGDLGTYAKHVGGAPLAIVLVMRGLPVDWSTYDEGRLAERIGLAATAHGLGSSIGWFNGDGPEGVKRLLGIPSDRMVRTAISIGLADWDRHRAGGRGNRPDARKPLAEIVHLDRWS